MSPAQIEANRANARLSTGPVTADGKRRSSLNSFKHGLTGKIHVVTTEEAAAFEQHLRTYHQAFAPVGILETELVQEIAEDKWRLARIRSIENSIFAGAAEAAQATDPTTDPTIAAALSKGQAWIQHERSFRLLVTYENRLHRAIDKNTAELKAMQAERKAAYAQAQREAIALFKLAKSEGRPYNPASDFEPAENHGGFVYSAPAIAQIIHREQRLRRIK